MKVYDYRIVEDLNLKTLKPYFFIQYYHLAEKKYILHSDATFQTLEEAQEPKDKTTNTLPAVIAAVL